MQAVEIALAGIRSYLTPFQDRLTLDGSRVDFSQYPTPLEDLAKFAKLGQEQMRDNSAKDAE
jgi:hypothetical protein